MREIDRLKARVKELEGELAHYKSRSQSQPVLMPTPGSAPDQQASAVGSQYSPPSASSPEMPLLQRTPSCSPKPQWKGIFVATTKSDQTSYYGPASLLYFVSRIGCYLGKALHQPHADSSFQTRGASRNMHAPLADADPAKVGEPTAVSATTDLTTVGADPHTGPLSRAQEESILNLFWEGYHCMFPIVDEADFRNHYASLWEPPTRKQRKQSALVDIILSLCLQYGYAFIPRSAAHPADRDAVFGDAAVAGRWYYRRSQSILTADLESPSITTVQCYIFINSYLCCASFQNMCQIITAQALRTAQVLGLHLEPPADMPLGQRELRKRIWWQVLTNEAKISTKLGRPYLVDWSQVTVSLPLDDAVTASYNNASLGQYSPSSDVSWLSFSLYNHKLFICMTSVHDALYDAFGQVVQQNSTSSTSVYQDPQALESVAKLLSNKLSTMWSWAEKLPEQLKLKRRSGGEPYSTDRSPVDLDMLAPVWLQRQRVCLELMYHSQIVNLTRPFISFYSHPRACTPMTERQANLCVSHAIAYTLIMHQVTTDSDIMGGWSEFFYQQWNSAITIVGFILAHPIHPTTPRARSALEKALAVFDVLSTNFAVCSDAARITRDLVGKADLIAGGAPSQPSTTITAPAAATIGSGSTDEMMVAPDATSVPSGDGSLAWLDPSLQNNVNYFNQEVMDWALSIDAYNSFDNFFDASNPVDPWLFGQT